MPLRLIILTGAILVLGLLFYTEQLFYRTLNQKQQQLLSQKQTELSQKMDELNRFLFFMQENSLLDPYLKKTYPNPSSLHLAQWELNRSLQEILSKNFPYINGFSLLITGDNGFFVQIGSKPQAIDYTSFLDNHPPDRSFFSPFQSIPMLYQENVEAIVLVKNIYHSGDGLKSGRLYAFVYPDFFYPSFNSSSNLALYNLQGNLLIGKDIYSKGQPLINSKIMNKENLVLVTTLPLNPFQLIRYYGLRPLLILLALFVVGYLIKDFLPKTPPTQGLANIRVNQAKIYITSHLDHRLTLALVAEELKLSPSYLSTIFSKIEGLPLNTYITKQKVDKAKELLQQPNIKVFEVALQLGYSDVQYFSKQFKKHCGQNPTEWVRSTNP